MTTRRWGIATVVVAAVIAIGMGLATAGDRGTGQAPGGMMDTASMGVGMMTSGDMEAMHEQMMATMAGAVPPGMLARCDTLHDQMRSVVNEAPTGARHGMHHWDAGNAA